MHAIDLGIRRHTYPVCNDSDDLTTTRLAAREEFAEQRINSMVLTSRRQ